MCHRGASALAHENTLPAFRLAMEHSVAMSELDVFMSADSQVMATHDPELKVAGRRIVVAELAADELAALDLGEGYGVPRLADVLDLVRGRMGIYVELKGPGTGTGVGRLLAAGTATGVDVIVGSFQLDLVAEVRAAAPDLPRSILFGRDTGLDRLVAEGRELGVTYAHPCFRPFLHLVDGLHAAGLRVMSPHSNDASELREFVNAGVDVVASDDPRLLQPLKVA